MIGVYVFTGGCKSQVEPKRNKEGVLNCQGKKLTAVVLGDAVLSISALVIGILSLLGVIPGVPPAAAYTLIGVSSAITLTWLALAIMTKGGVVSEVAKFLREEVFCPKDKSKHYETT